MEAFLKPLSEAERQVQLLRFAIETQQHAEELRAKRKREKDKKKKPGRPFKARCVDETLMAAASQQASAAADTVSSTAPAASNRRRQPVAKRIHWFVKHPDLVHDVIAAVYLAGQHRARPCQVWRSTI